jgi:transcriptional regulator with XRE-family HTH domain
MMQTLTPTQRRAVNKRAAVLIAEELSLRNLRKALNLTQSDVAKRLGKGQDEVSRVETRPDLLISTLHRYIESLGGELELIARFKKRKPVRLTSGLLRDAVRTGARARPEKQYPVR